MFLRSIYETESRSYGMEDRGFDVIKDITKRNLLSLNPFLYTVVTSST